MRLKNTPTLRLPSDLANPINLPHPTPPNKKAFQGKITSAGGAVFLINVNTPAICSQKLYAGSIANRIELVPKHVVISI